MIGGVGARVAVIPSTLCGCAQAQSPTPAPCIGASGPATFADRAKSSCSQQRDSCGFLGDLLERHSDVRGTSQSISRSGSKKVPLPKPSTSSSGPFDPSRPDQGMGGAEF